MRGKRRAPTALRLAAVPWLANRGWGKATQVVEGSLAARMSHLDELQGFLTESAILPALSAVECDAVLDRPRLSVPVRSDRMARRQEGHSLASQSTHQLRGLLSGGPRAGRVQSAPAGDAQGPSGNGGDPPECRAATLRTIVRAGDGGAAPPGGWQGAYPPRRCLMLNKVSGGVGWGGVVGSQSIGDAWSVRLAQEVAPDEVDLAPVWAAAFVEGGRARQQFFASGRGAPASGSGVPPSEVAGADFLYLTGQARLTLGAEEADVLRRVLEGGGVVLGEGCAAGPEGDAGAREFVRSFAEAASQLGRQLARVERNDTLLTARFVFSGPPAVRRTRWS